MFHAIELLLKERLAQTNPILIYKNIDTKITDDAQTVGIREALVRLENLGLGIPAEEKKTIENIQKVRNRIEHHPCRIRTGQCGYWCVHVTSALAFPPRRRKPSRTSRKSGTASNITHAVSGPANAVIGVYMYKLGYPVEAAIYITTAMPENFAWLTEADGKRVGISAEISEEAPAAVPTVVPVADPVAPSTASDPPKVKPVTKKMKPWHNFSQKAN